MKWKFLSLDDIDNPSLISFETHIYAQLKIWADKKSSLIHFIDDTIKCRFDALNINDKWDSIEYAFTKDTYIQFIDIKEEEKILYGLEIEKTYKEPYLGDEYVRDVVSEKYLLLKIDFKTGKTIRKELSKLIPNKMFINDIKHVGNEEFIAFTNLRGGKKVKYYLYKIAFD